jgi:hypothetical protein
VSNESKSTVEKFQTIVQDGTFSSIELFDKIISVGILFEDDSVAIVKIFQSHKLTQKTHHIFQEVFIIEIGVSSDKFQLLFES